MKKKLKQQKELIVQEEETVTIPEEQPEVKVESFLTFMCHREQLISLAVLIILLLGIGAFMRTYYEIPFIYPDSNTYVKTAMDDDFDIYRPNGYPHFLQFVHGITPKLSGIFWSQYLMFAVSTLMLLFSAKYVLKIKTGIFWAMSLLAILSARLIFSTNYIMSDSIFTSLCALFMTSCLWAIHKRSYTWMIIGLIILWPMCSIRYSGLFFIPVLLVTYIVSLLGVRKIVPWFLLLLPPLLGVLFYKTTRAEYKEVTDRDVFACFSGWQKINNASVLFPEAKEIPMRKFHGSEVRKLHVYMQSVPDSVFSAERTFSTDYMWNNKGPYKQYTFKKCMEFKRLLGLQWIISSEVFGRYADQLVKQEPFRYCKLYILPSLWSNTKFHPFAEENTVFSVPDLYQQYYGIDLTDFKREVSFFQKTDGVRRIAQVIYWICAVISALLFFIMMRKECFKDRAWLCLFVFMLSFIFIIGGQTISCPCTTWRYTMCFYQISLVFMFAFLSYLLDSDFWKKLISLVKKEQGKD